MLVSDLANAAVRAESLGPQQTVMELLNVPYLNVNGLPDVDSSLEGAIRNKNGW